jgi:hypothetical protein
MDSTEEDAVTPQSRLFPNKERSSIRPQGCSSLLHGIDDQAAFDMLRSQHTNIKLRTLAKRMVFDYRALSNAHVMKARAVYENTGNSSRADHVRPI